ncbi:hypothetical protein [Alkalihalobacillus sp. 1P02AB]|uniref:hypothetical protein n=1 Tax=Alkalihalobacillus sp. 1P02AB TaxID=3132260 RepID=UPI0039A597E8
MSIGIKKAIVIVCFLLLTISHFDFWWFGKTEPIILGFMPIALWFQVLTGGILASVFLFYAYKVIWPDIPDSFENEEEVTLNREDK